MNGESRPNEASDDPESGCWTDSPAHRDRIAVAVRIDARANRSAPLIEKILSL